MLPGVLNCLILGQGDNDVLKGMEASAAYQAGYRFEKRYNVQMCTDKDVPCFKLSEGGGGGREGGGVIYSHAINYTALRSKR